jgi:GntR family transcriptional regulator
MQATASVPLFEAIAPETAGMPLYRVVKRSLLGAIASGACGPGDTLPSEAEIAAAMHISIGTLRRAVDELAAEHILVRRQGRGTFVARARRDAVASGFFQVEAADGRLEPPEVGLIAFSRGRAEPGPARALRLVTGDAVFFFECVQRLRGVPVVHDRSTLPAALFKGLTEKRLREHAGALYAFFQADFGVAVARAPERARAIAADRAAARLFGMPTGQPVMQVRRTAFTGGGEPVEHRVSLIDTSHHDYINRLARAPGPVLFA